jgi:hypothetical protein
MADLASQVHDLVEHSLDPHLPVTTLLRKALVVARIKSDKEFVKWIEFELNGYPDRDSLPEYRVLHGSPMGYDQLRGWESIPVYNLSEEQVEAITVMYFTWPLSKFENDLKDNSNAFITTYGTQGERILTRALHYRARPGLMFTRSQFEDMLDAARNKVLYWALAQEQRGSSPGLATNQVSGATDAQNIGNAVTADQLYDKAKLLYAPFPEIDDPTARLIIQLADDATIAFGNTNQEKKVELKKIKLDAEKLLPPATLEDLKKRAESAVLTTYPSKQRTRKILIYAIAVIISLTAVVGAWELIAPSRYKPSNLVNSLFEKEKEILDLKVKLSNKTTNDKVISTRGEFWLWLPNKRRVAGRYELRLTNEGEAPPTIDIKAGKEVDVFVKFLNRPGFIKYYEAGDCDLTIFIREANGQSYSNNSIVAFNQKTFESFYLPIEIGK